MNDNPGAISVPVEGIQAKCQAALAADPYPAEIERSASGAMAAMRKTLSHLRPIRTTPVEAVPGSTRRKEDFELLTGHTDRR